MIKDSIKKISRNKFLSWSMVALFAGSAIKWMSNEPAKKKGTNKYLTEDGKLVEVDKLHPGKKMGKVYLSDLKNWIKK